MRATCMCVLALCRDMGLELFRRYIVMNPLVQTRIVEGLLMLIEKERQGDTVDRSYASEKFVTNVK